MTQTTRPLLTRAQVEAMRVRRAKHRAAGLPFSETHTDDLIDTLIAAFGQLAAVDEFAQEEEMRDQDVVTDAYARGYNALRRELRALRGIEA